MSRIVVAVNVPPFDLMVMSLPLVARFPSLSTLKKVGNDTMSVVTAWSRDATRVLPVVDVKSTVMLRFPVPPPHEPMRFILNVHVALTLNTLNLLVVVLKNGAKLPDAGVSAFNVVIRFTAVVPIARLNPVKVNSDFLLTLDVPAIATPS